MEKYREALQNWENSEGDQAMDTDKTRKKSIKGKRKLELEIRDRASKRSDYDGKDWEVKQIAL